MKLTNYIYDKLGHQSFAVCGKNKIPFSVIKKAFLPTSKVEVTNKDGIYIIDNANSKLVHNKFIAAFLKPNESDTYFRVNLYLRLENGFSDNIIIHPSIRIDRGVTTLRMGNTVEFDYEFEVELYLHNSGSGSVLSARFCDEIDKDFLKALIDWSVYLDDYIDRAKDVTKLLSSIYLQTKTIKLFNFTNYLNEAELKIDYQESFVTKIFGYILRFPEKYDTVSALLNQIISELGGYTATAEFVLLYIQNVVLKPDVSVPCFNYHGWHMSLKFFKEGIILFFSKENIYVPIVFLHSSGRYNCYEINNNIRRKTSLKTINGNAEVKRYFCVTNGFKDDIHSIYDCSLLRENRHCNSEKCGIKCNIEDYTSTINEDARNWNESYPYLVVRKEIVDDWKRLRPDVYGLFSMRKSGKSTTVKAILGFESFLYINLAEGAWEYRVPGELPQKKTKADPDFKDYADFNFNLVDYFKYIFSIFEGSINSRSIVIDECERIFKELLKFPDVAEHSLMFLTSLACNSKVILCGQDRVYIDNLLPYDSPINSMKELRLELFSKDETYELLNKITKDKFVLSEHLMENIYNATSGHPRLIVNIIIRLIKMLSTYKTPLNTNIDMIYIKETLLANNAIFRTYFDWGSVIKPLAYYQSSQLLSSSIDIHLANLLYKVFSIFKQKYLDVKVYSASYVIPEESLLEDSNITTENLDYLIALNFLVVNANNEYYIKIPLLFNIFIDNGNLFDYLDN